MGICEREKKKITKFDRTGTINISSHQISSFSREWGNRNDFNRVVRTRAKLNAFMVLKNDYLHSRKRSILQGPDIKATLLQPVYDATMAYLPSSNPEKAEMHKS